MKKITSIIILFMLALSLTACGAEVDSAKGNTSKKETVSETKTTSDEGTVSTNSTEWKQFIKEYEDWADDYIVLIKKYQKNPTDATILTDYTEFASKTAEWTERAGKVTTALGNSPEAIEYSSELMRIAKKISDASASLSE